jgi:Ca-activated chloride channel family protein
VGTLAALLGFVRDRALEWRGIRIEDLQFWHRDSARLALLLLVGLTAALLVLRIMMRRRPGRERVALPAVLPWSRESRLALVRHATLLLFLIGLPFFILALADPYTSFSRQTVSYPGRRISILIDASSSMYAPFTAKSLNAHAPVDAAFFTSVSAADYFVRLRMKGQYHDLIGLVEFGDEAYVVTPFTGDYENILLSISLIGDLTEWGKFPDQGTIIAQAIEQGTALFRAFNYLNAAGNLMVIFSDGQDSQVTVHGRHVDSILADAVLAKIPVYMIRTSYKRELGGIVPDDIWKPAVEKTGGKYYAAADEATILRAVHEIDDLSGGKVQINQYGSQTPKFSPFAFAAVGLWSLAIVLQLSVPMFRKFP